MKETYEHIKIESTNFIAPRKKRAFGKTIVREKYEKLQFHDDSIENISNIIDYSNKMQEIMNYDDNSLIFSINLRKDANVKDIESNLSKMDIEIISMYKNEDDKNIIVINRDNIEKLKSKIEDYPNKESKYDFLNYINYIKPIKTEDKIGLDLQSNPLNDNFEYLNIELWLDKYNEEELDKKINIIKNYLKIHSHFRICDYFVFNSFALLRVYMNKEIMDKIIKFPYIALIYRPNMPYINIYEYNNLDIKDVKTKEPPKNSTGILIIDSGIVSNHPMLEKCIGAEENFQTKEKEIQDTSGHGTSVAGCAAYYSIEECVNNKIFEPSNYIYSAKVMYSEEDLHGNKSPKYDPEKLLESQFYDAIEHFLENSSYNIKCVNISLGNTDEEYKYSKNMRQFPLAELIDNLALKYNNTVFVISSGNSASLSVYNSIEDIKNDYPKYLSEDGFHIINPATSALSITVGSISSKINIQDSNYRKDENIRHSISNENEPSLYTRAGPGINNMIKPELVDYGGNMILYNEHNRIKEDIGGKLVLLNNFPLNKLFRYDIGTSFSAAKVSHIIGKIANQYPEASSNFIKNLLLSGADYPSQNKNNDKNIIGYGIANYEKSVSSYNNRVLLYDESSIEIDNFKIYSINLPEIFFSEKGNKKIIITLTFNPKIRRSRLDYISNQIKCYLYHTISIDELHKKYRDIKNNDELESDNKKLEKYKIDLYGSKMIFSGCHQKYIKEYKREPKTMPLSPISLVLVNENKWLKVDENKQNYCLSIIFEHEEEIDLYNQIKNTIKTRAKIRD